MRLRRDAPDTSFQDPQLEPSPELAARVQRLEADRARARPKGLLARLRGERRVLLLPLAATIGGQAVSLEPVITKTIHLGVDVYERVRSGE